MDEWDEEEGDMMDEWMDSWIPIGDEGWNVRNELGIKWDARMIVPTHDACVC